MIRRSPDGRRARGGRGRRRRRGRRPDVHVPRAGGPGRLEPGEAVLVEFGRRQALGIVLGEAAAAPAPAIPPKPIVERVRADGPLLPPLGARPRALDRRALPRAAGARPAGDAAAGSARAPRARGGARPGRGPAAPTDAAGDAGRAVDLLDAAGRRAAAGRDLAAPEGRARTRSRRLRALAGRRAGSAWSGRCSAPAAGPRYERWIAADATTGAGRRGRAGRRRDAAGPAARAAAGRRASPSWPALASAAEAPVPARTCGAARQRRARRRAGPARPRRRGGPRAAAPAARRPTGRAARRAAAGVGPDAGPGEARRRDPGRDRRRATRARCCSRA